MEDKVLESVVERIGYKFEKDVLVKPLGAIMITKEVTEAIGTGEKDVDGFEKMETHTETKEVESDFAKGLVLAMPTSIDSMEDQYKPKYTVGNTIVYPKKFAKDFDLFKDSQLIKLYDVVAICD